MKPRIVDSVDIELKRIVTHLESAREGTGYRLYSEFLEAGDTIALNPRFSRAEDAGPIRGEFREVLLLNASYRIIFEIRDSEVGVVSLVHTHRRPGSWQRSLDEVD